MSGELLPPPADNSLLFGPSGAPTARVEIIADITGCDEPALRQMASAGYIPALRRRTGHLEQTLRGVFRCLRERLDRRAEKNLPTLASMDWSEGAGLFTKKFLQMLKAAGLPGFNTNNSIDLNQLLPALEPWLTGDNQRDKHELQLHGVATWTQYREKFQALNEKIEHDKNAAAVMDYTQAIDLGRNALSIYFTSLDRLAVDLPGRLAGRTPAEIKTTLDTALAKIRAHVQAEFTTRHQAADHQRATQAANAKEISGAAAVKLSANAK